MYAERIQHKLKKKKNLTHKIIAMSRTVTLQYLHEQEQAGKFVLLKAGELLLICVAFG